MKTWFCIPTANAVQCGETFKRWKDKGYHTAALLNGPVCDLEVANCDISIYRPEYPGWGESFNILVRILMDRDAILMDTKADLFVTGGDDTFPCELTADQVRQQFLDHFPDGFGCMQPIGDDWPHGRMRMQNGSPFFGREFCQRWNGGRGALWPDYVHHFCDVESYLTTSIFGVLWQRDDLSHYHDNYARKGPVDRPPDYMRRAYSAHNRDRQLFQNRKAAGFPGHKPTGRHD